MVHEENAYENSPRLPRTGEHGDRGSITGSCIEALLLLTKGLGDWRFLYETTCVPWRAAWII